MIECLDDAVFDDICRDHQYCRPQIICTDRILFQIETPDVTQLLSALFILAKFLR